jgi:hypothetical protein
MVSDVSPLHESSAYDVRSALRCRRQPCVVVCLLPWGMVIRGTCQACIHSRIGAQMNVEFDSTAYADVQ